MEKSILYFCLQANEDLPSKAWVIYFPLIKNTFEHMKVKPTFKITCYIVFK